MVCITNLGQLVKKVHIEDIRNLPINFEEAESILIYMRNRRKWYFHSSWIGVAEWITISNSEKVLPSGHYDKSRWAVQSDCWNIALKTGWKERYYYTVNAVLESCGKEGLQPEKILKRFKK